MRTYLTYICISYHIVNSGLEIVCINCVSVNVIMWQDSGGSKLFTVYTQWISGFDEGKVLCSGLNTTVLMAFFLAGKPYIVGLSIVR